MLNGILEAVEERILELVNEKYINWCTKRKQGSKPEEDIRDVWGIMKRSNLHVIWIPEGEEMIVTMLEYQGTSWGFSKTDEIHQIMNPKTF